MRQKRAKKYRKLMSLYRMSFGFREPYQVLVDSAMCILAAESKFDLAQRLSTVLQGSIKPMITQCSVHELYLQGRELQPAVDIAKTYERRKCNHREPIAGDDCLAGVVGASNKHRYVVATQSQPLRAKLRLVPAVPIIHVARAVMVLEPPSDETLRRKHFAEQQALGPTASELAKLPSPPNARTRRKRGPQAPNPLSVKKKVVKASQPRNDGPSVGEKRRHEGVDDHGDHARKRKRRRKHASLVHVL